MLGVGFEPTHTNIAGLKSAPLDQLGQPSGNKYYLLTPFYIEYKITVMRIIFLFLIITVYLYNRYILK